MKQMIVFIALCTSCTVGKQAPSFPRGEGHYLLLGEELDQTLYTLRRKLTRCTSHCHPHLRSWKVLQRRTAHYCKEVRRLPYSTLHQLCQELREQLTLPLHNSHRCNARQRGKRNAAESSACPGTQPQTGEEEYSEKKSAPIWAGTCHYGQKSSLRVLTLRPLLQRATHRLGEP